MNSTRFQLKFSEQTMAEEVEDALDNHRGLNSATVFRSKNGNHVVEFFGSNHVVGEVEDEGTASDVDEVISQSPSI